jgi:hypothetical protein
MLWLAVTLESNKPFLIIAQLVSSQLDSIPKINMSVVFLIEEIVIYLLYR